MKIYHYDIQTGALLDEGVADASPLEVGVWLVPAHATSQVPPVAAAQQVPCFDGAGWVSQPDWRGVALWSVATAEPVAIQDIGVTPEAVGATALPRPSPAYRWQGEGWVLDAALRLAYLEALRQQQLTAVLLDAGRQLASLAGRYPDAEVQSWSQQAAEAAALAADPAAEVPLLAVIAAARGVAVSDLAAWVREKSRDYTLAAGQIIGQRQALADALAAVDLSAADAEAQLQAVRWPA